MFCAGMRTHRDEVVALIRKEFRLAPDTATQVYEALLPAISTDGRASESGILNIVRDSARSSETTRAISLADVVDYRLLGSVRGGN